MRWGVSQPQNVDSFFGKLYLFLYIFRICPITVYWRKEILIDFLDSKYLIILHERCRVLSKKGSYKYQCLGCSKFIFITRVERTHRARPICQYCGSHRLDPLKGLKAKYRILSLIFLQYWPVGRSVKKNISERGFLFEIFIFLSPKK